MRPKTSTEASLNNKFHLGKFEKSTDQKYGIIIKTSPFSKAFLLEDILAATSTFVTPGKTRTKIKYIENKWRLTGLLWVLYDSNLLDFMRSQTVITEIFKAYDQKNNYFLIPLRVHKDSTWPVGTSPVYQLKYFGIPTIATAYDTWSNLNWLFGKWVTQFKYLEYDYESKETRIEFVTQFTYLVDGSPKII